MPTANGTARPRGMPALADQRVPRAWATRFTAIDAQACLEGRDGSRPGRGALEAVRALPFALHDGRDGSLRAADIPGVFDPLDQTWLVAMVRLRLDDRALRRRRHTGLKAGMGDTEGQGVPPETGTPQGGTGSPVLAQGSLHEALDRWCAHVVTPPGRGEARWCRAAEDWGSAFRLPEDADRWCRVRPKRRGPCPLQGAPETTHLRRFRRFHPCTQRRCTLLGCACFWRPARHGVPRVRRRTARQKLPAACQRLTAWLKPHRPLPGRACCQRLHARRRGPDNSEGVRGNARARNRFFPGAMDGTCTGLNRRGGTPRSATWEPWTHGRDRVKGGRPRMTEVPRRRVVA